MTLRMSCGSFRTEERNLVRTLVRHHHSVVAALALLALLPSLALAAVTHGPRSALMPSSPTPAASAFAVMDAAQGRDDFPRIRQTVRYQRMNWETGDASWVRRSLPDSAPFLPTRPLAAPAPASLTIRASVPDYRVDPGLSNVINARDFGTFAPDQRRRLEQLGFVVTTADQPQMFYIYEQNVYANLPNFVTTDVFLHTLGDLYAYTLKTVERRVLFGWTLHLARALRAESLRQARASADTALRTAALENAAYFAVAEELLSGRRVTLPPIAAAIVRSELARIRAAAGMAISFTGHEVDYGEFRPRGHYTLSADAKNYFRAVQWLGQVPFDLPRDESFSKDVLRAQLAILALRDGKGSGALRAVTAEAMRRRIDDLVGLFTAQPSTLSPQEWRGAMVSVYGDSATAARLLDPGLQRRFLTTVRAVPQPPMRRITAETLSPWHMRFLPRRAVLDAEIMQKLVGLDRPHSRAIDVMTVLGNPRARDLVEASGRAGLPDWYPERIEELRQRVAGFVPEQWAAGIYSGFLWLYNAVAPVTGTGTPWFTRSTAWMDRCLTAAAGSWAELRHHTILYSESYGAEGGGDVYQTELPKGYVEPNPVFFHRVRWLSEKLRADLSSRGCLTERMDEKLVLFTEMARQAATIAGKELEWRSITEEEYKFIHFIGSDLAKITTGCLLNDIDDARGIWDTLPESQKSMAMVADVGTARGQALTVATGLAQELYVAVPSRRGPRLTRGAVYEYFEFLQPIEDRLTDEAWRTRLASDARPVPTAWQGAYRSPSAKPAPTGLAEQEGLGFDYTFTAD